MNTVIATPMRSLLLLLVWCALHNSVSPLIMVTGVLLAIGIPWLTRGFRTPQPAVRRYGLLLQYLLKVLKDIVVANLQVVRVVLAPNERLRPGFVRVPLDLTEPLPLTILAGTICLTPGTVSAEFLPGHHDEPAVLLVHVLDLQDEERLIQELKQRYEKPLKEIFACSV